MDTFVSILLFFLIFGIIVLAHEFGHYILAKANGIRVVEFFIGMGPTLVSFTKNDTKYSIKLLPIGGACMFEGEDGLDVETAKKNLASQNDMQGEAPIKAQEALLVKNSEKTGAFPDANVWARISTVLAGPVFNVILAWFLAMIMVGMSGSTKPVIHEVMDGYPAKEAGLAAGDVITSINGHKTNIYQEVQLKIVLNFDGAPLDVTYLRDGEKKSCTIEPKFSEETGTYLMGITGGEYYRPRESMY